MPLSRLLLLVGVLVASMVFAIAGLSKLHDHSQMRRDALHFAEVFGFDPQSVTPQTQEKAQQIVSCTITNLWADVTDAPAEKDATLQALRDEVGSTYAQVAMNMAQQWSYESVPIPRIYLEQNHWRVGVEDWFCPLL